MLRMFQICFIFVASFIFLQDGFAEVSTQKLRRHYFTIPQVNECSQIKKDMSKAEARSLCQAREYPSFETVRNGFSFAVDEQRSGLFTFSHWMPPADQDLDFFVSPESVFLIYYDDQERISIASEYSRQEKGKMTVRVQGVSKRNLDTSR